MKIATWNVNSIAIRLEHVFKWLSDTGTDVLCLQETKCVDEKFPMQAIRDFGYEAAFVGEKSYNGVAILSKHEITDVQKNFHDDVLEAPKRLIAATVNGAFASGLGEDVGPLEPGKCADLLILNSPSYARLPYDASDDPIRAVVKDGWLVVDQGARVA